MHCRFVPAENKTNKENKPQPFLPQQQKIKHTQKKSFISLFPPEHTLTFTPRHSFLVRTSTIFYILDNGLPFGGSGSD